MTDVFRSRVNTDVQPVQQRDPAAFRSGVVDGVEKVGQALQAAGARDAAVKGQIYESDTRLMEIERKRAIAAKSAEVLTRLPDVQDRINTTITELRRKYPAGGAEYVAKANEAITAQLKDFGATLGDTPEIRQQFEPVIARLAVGTRAEQVDWSIKTGAAVQGQQIDGAVDKLSNALNDPAMDRPTAAQRLDTAMTAIDAMVGELDVDEAVRLKLKSAYRDRLTTGFLNGRMAAGDHQGVRSALDSGQLDYIDPRLKDNFRSQTDVAQAQDERVAAQAVAEQRDAVRDQVAAYKKRIEFGEVPTQAEATALYSAAQAVKLDPADLVEIRGLSVQVGINRQYAPMIGKPGGADAIRRATERLQAKRDGGTATPDEQIALTQLTKLVDKADDAEVANLKPLAAKGPEGALQAIAQLRGSRDAVFDRAEKLAPGLGAVALLAPGYRRDALEGRAIRQSGKEGDARKWGDPKVVEQTAAGALGPIAGELMRGGQYDALVNTAWDMMASWNARHGVSGFNGAKFREALIYASGGRARPTGAIEGGIQNFRGRPVQLPDWQTATEFDGMIARTDFSNAIYANGKPAVKADIVANYTPRYIGEDEQGRFLYHMVDAEGGALIDKGRSPIVLVARKPAGR